MAQSALDKALSVVEALVSFAPEAPLASIAERAGLSKPTTHRILQNLIARQYARGGDGLYQPGAQILALAGQVLMSLDYGRLARGALLELQGCIPETIHFGVLQGHDVVYVEKLEALGAFRMSSSIGMKLPLHSTAIGKCVLANVSSNERDALLGTHDLLARTTRTITDRAQLEADLAKVAAAGFAFDDEENEEGVRCLGAPVFGIADSIVGGVSVSAPMFRLTPDRVTELAPAVMHAAAEVSRSLGAAQFRRPHAGGGATTLRGTSHGAPERAAEGPGPSETQPRDDSRTRIPLSTKALDVSLNESVRERTGAPT